MFKIKKSATVKEIHDQFDSAAERLLLEAKKIIGNKSDKGERLAKIGFIKTKDAAKHLNESAQANLILSYQIKYPFLKFITESDMDNLCTKYNLIHAPISNYIGEVPGKNLREIELIPVLKSNDAPEDIKMCKLKRENFIIGGHQFLSMIWPTWWTMPRIIEGNYFSQYDVNDYLNKKYDYGFEYLVSSIKNITINRQGLFIAAPKKHFDTKGLQASGKFGLFSFLVEEPKDPIVFRYVKGGIQILSKWGDEASDKDLVNQIDN